VSGYTQGRAVEHDVIAHLQGHGYDTVRAASSKGLADVVAIKPGQVLLVNCKRTTMPGPGERIDLIRIASCLPGVSVPLVALHPRGKPLQFRRLTGIGPKAWVVWTADELEEIA
jgi:Holliday junction resolvase